MSTINVSNLKNPSAANPAFVLASDGSATANLSSLNGGPIAGSRNRIINGDMRIDQRNAGASVTPTADSYVIDRWGQSLNVASKYSAQRNAGSVTPPAGFTNYLGITSLSAYAVTGNDAFSVQQIIEGFNVSDLNWGTASATPATLSFWVRSSLTGTFGGSIATTKTAVWVMPFSYTIASANTWTYITVPITAPTATGGTNNDNTAGAYLRFGLGAAGLASGGTVGTWTNAGNYLQPSGTVSVVGTNGATFYITGVQLEPGTVATPFERRSYGAELALCQRYYIQDGVDAATPVIGFMSVVNNSTAKAQLYVFPAIMRAAPTVTATGDYTLAIRNPKTGSVWFSTDSLSSGTTAAIYKITASAEL